MEGFIGDGWAIIDNYAGPMDFERFFFFFSFISISDCRSLLLQPANSVWWWVHTTVKIVQRNVHLLKGSLDGS